MTDIGSITLRARGIFAALQPCSNHVRLAVAASVSAPQAASFVRADNSDDSVPEIVSGDNPSDSEDINVNSGRGALRSVSEQVSFGGVLGYATGYTIRKVGKAAMFFVGAEVVILQYMAYRQWVEIDWARMGRDLSPKLSKSTWDGLVDILVYKMPFSVAFTGGLVAALRIPPTK